MPLRPFKQIKWKLTLVILGTSSVVLVLAAVTVGIYDALNSRQNLLSQVETIAEITAANSAAALAFHNSGDAQETLDSLRARQEIDFAGLYLADGQPFVTFIRDGQPPVAAVPTLKQASHQFENGRWLVNRKVKFGQDTVGTLVIYANLQQQSARSRTFLGIASLTLAGLLGVALLLAARLQRLVSNPIAELAQVAQHITQHNDYRVRAILSSSDEIGALVAAFNQMLTEIERQNRILVENESHLKLALSASAMGVWEWNFQTDAVSWSVENTGVFGVPTRLTSLASFGQLIHPEDANPVLGVVKAAAEKLAAFSVEYRIAPNGTDLVWVAHHGQVRRDATGTPTALAGIVQNISARKLAETERQKLLACLLHAEEDERRRIARELHDTTAQHLAALKINFAGFWAGPAAPPSPRVLAESRALLDVAIHEISTLAYVLHPPVLEEFGLVDALQDFALGVTRRSGVHILVAAEDYSGRLPSPIELTLFRVIQESIANAVRHSGTKQIHIRLVRDAQEVQVEIQDFGRGLPVQPTLGDTKFLHRSGVGLAAMRERLTLVGGLLNVESDPEGVTVLASVPLAVALAAGDPPGREAPPA